MAIFRVLFLLLLVPLQLISDASDTNVLIYTNTVQVNSEIYQYENINPGIPIQGSVMITHDVNNTVDVNSFKLGDRPLKVDLVQSVPMSSDSKLVVSIYQFQLEGMKAGLYTLAPIEVVVGGKAYLAPPMTIQVGD